MRAIFITAAVMLLVVSQPPSALAQEQTDGWRASYTITMQFGDEFIKLMQKQAGQTAELTVDDLEMLPVSGMLYFDRQRLRMDMTIPYTSEILSSIVDQPAKTLYLVNHAARSVWAFDLSAYIADYESQGLPVMNPDQIFLHWEDVQRILDATPGIKSAALGAKQINGRACHGLKFAGRIEDVLKSSSVLALPNLPVLKDVTGMWSGEYWIDDEHGLPVRQSMKMLGMTYMWDISDLKPQPSVGALLGIPRGYHVEQRSLADIAGGTGAPQA